MLGGVRAALRGARALLLVVYPNSGEVYLSRELEGGETGHWRAGQEDQLAGFLDHVDAWVGAGAGLVGGCCRVTPHHIAQLVSRSLELANPHTISHNARTCHF